MRTITRAEFNTITAPEVPHNSFWELCNMCGDLIRKDSEKEFSGMKKVGNLTIARYAHKKCMKG